MDNKLVEALAVLDAMRYLEIGKMSAVDQLKYCLAVLEFAENLEPFIKKYGGSVEELQKRKEVKEQEDIKTLQNIIEQVEKMKK